MLRARPVVRTEDDTVVKLLPRPDAVHDPQLEETLRRLSTPPPAPPTPHPLPRPAPDRAVYGLD
jgi:hypothetical protein